MYMHVYLYPLMTTLMRRASNILVLILLSVGPTPVACEVMRFSCNSLLKICKQILGSVDIETLILPAQ